MNSGSVNPFSLYVQLLLLALPSRTSLATRQPCRKPFWQAWARPSGKAEAKKTSLASPTHAKPRGARRSTSEPRPTPCQDRGVARAMPTGPLPMDRQGWNGKAARAVCHAVCVPRGRCSRAGSMAHVRNAEANMWWRPPPTTHTGPARAGSLVSHNPQGWKRQGWKWQGWNDRLRLHLSGLRAHLVLASALHQLGGSGSSFPSPAGGLRAAGLSFVGLPSRDSGMPPSTGPQTRDLSNAAFPGPWLPLGIFRPSDPPFGRSRLFSALPVWPL